MRGVFDWIKRNFSLIAAAVTVLASVPFLFVSFGGSKHVSNGMFLLVFMSLSWALMPWSIYVTSLFPIVLLPLLSLASASKAASLYFNDAICLFVGSFVLTAAMERWQLHKRMALKMLVVFKTPLLMLAAIMASTAFLSLFISNTSAAALMVSLVLPILKGEEGDSASSVSIDEEVSVAMEADDVPLDQKKGEDNGQKIANERYGKSLLLAVAYSASLGGVGTLVGTGPNLALVQIVPILYPNFPGLSFGLWSAFAIVIVLFCLLGLFGMLFLWNRKTLHAVSFPLDRHRRDLDAMGSTSFEEIVVLLAVMFEILLWLTRTGFPPALPGWGKFVFSGYVQDGTICMAVSCLLFLIPSRSKPGETILPASAIGSLHWDVILLLGAGFAIGYGFAAGLTEWIGLQLTSLKAVPAPIVVVLLTVFTSFFTEVCSNVASANILLPVASALAQSLNQNPLLFMVPVTIACSLAFCLPVATPPNALAVSTGLLQTSDMLRIGLVFNFVCAAFVSAWTLIGGPILGIHLNSIPLWANNTL